MAHTTHIAPLDLAPTGHLPAIVAQAALTPAQADGLACIHCGREDGPMVPAGTVNGTQVFRCSPACPTDDEPAHTRPAHVAEILDTVEAHLPHVDPELAARGREAIAAARTAEAPCPVFEDCEAVGPHHDHYGHSLPGLEVRDDTGEVILDAGFAAASGDTPHERRPAVYLCGSDFDSAAAVRAATARLRQLLDEVDRMADRVFADHEARG